MLYVRRQYPVFATGSVEVLPADNPSVIAYLRAPRGAPGGEGPAADGEGGGGGGGGGPAESTGPAELATVLCVCNLSRFAQPVELSLTGYEHNRPVELLGRVPFPVIGPAPYPVMLPPYGFCWFELQGGFDV